MTIYARLDARPDRIDLRDRKYTPPLRSLEHQFPSAHVIEKALPLYRQHDMVLDQGHEGACTGFGLAATINSLLWRRKLLHHDATGTMTVRPDEAPPGKVSTRMLYHLARFYDEWPGEDYEGSSCRGAIKAWFKHGVCSERIWPYYNPANNRAEFVSPAEQWQQDAAARPLGVYYRIENKSITDMQAAIQEVGAIYCSADVHRGWELPGKGGRVSHGSLPLIKWRPENEKTGGHAFALIGYNRRGFIIQNSWGPNWGQYGFAILGYKDWVENGSDAWVCVMGAQTSTEMPAHFTSSSLYREQEVFQSHAGLSLLLQSPPPSDVSKEKKAWNKQQAYRHSIVMGNDGKVINRLVDQPDGREAVKKLAITLPNEFFKQNPATPPKIVIYAHGGLNSEGASLDRIQAMGPYFEANGIYPLFFSWKTGLLESIYSIIADGAKRLFPQSGGLQDFIDEAKKRLDEAMDRTLEVACENLGAKAIWSQMKQNAAAASRRENNERGVFLTTLALSELKRQIPDLEIHLIGHSAGSILLGHMLDDFPRNGLEVASCTLYAPACSVDFAIRHYQKAVTGNKILSLDDLYIHLLDDKRERNDTVGPYRKSLLYLVSRALEDQHKMPLLGMQNAFDRGKTIKGKDYTWWHPSTLNSLKKWQDFWGSRELETIETDEVPTVARWRRGKVAEVIKSIDTAHGAFDNDVQVIDTTLRRITGESSLKRKVDNLVYD